MGRRGVMAAVFLTMAVGLAGAYDDAPMPPENTIDCVVRASKTRANAVEAYGQFAGFKTKAINKSTITFYTVVISDSGVRTETPIPPPRYATFGDSASNIHSETINIPVGAKRICAVYEITNTSNSVPDNGRYSCTSGDYIVP